VVKKTFFHPQISQIFADLFFKKNYYGTLIASIVPNFLKEKRVEEYANHLLSGDQTGLGEK